MSLGSVEYLNWIFKWESADKRRTVSIVPTGLLRAPEVSRRSISPTRCRSVTGFYCNIYILIPSTPAFYSGPDAKQEGARTTRRNIYPAIRTCNNSGYFDPRRQMHRACGPFMQSAPLFDFHRNILRQWRHRPLPSRASFPINRPMRLRAQANPPKKKKKKGTEIKTAHPLSRNTRTRMCASSRYREKKRAENIYWLIVQKAYQTFCANERIKL